MYAKKGPSQSVNWLWYHTQNIKIIFLWYQLLRHQLHSKKQEFSLAHVVPKLLKSVSTLYTNLPFWTRLPVPPIYSTTILKCIFLEIPYLPFHSNLVFRVPWQLELDGDRGRSLSAAEPAAAGYHAREFHAQLVGDGLTLPVMESCHFMSSMYEKNTDLHHLRCHHRLPKAHKHKPPPRSWCHAGQTEHQNTCSNLQRVNLKQKKLVGFIWPSS